MKSVLISIKPKYCELIASGKKTVEIRKTRPKLETPFKCYIYCTLQDCNEFFKDTLNSDISKWNSGKWFDKKGKVIGEFVCNHITNIEVLKSGLFTGGYPNGHCKSIVENSMLSALEIKNYANTKANVYGWHISNLVIYDKPKKISDFQKPCNHYNDCSTCKRFDRKDYACICGITRPPMSWCYVEGL